MKDVVVGIIVLFVLIGITYGGWLIKRGFNYSFDHEDKVTQTIEKKHEKRIQELEQRVRVLEKNHG